MRLTSFGVMLDKRRAARGLTWKAFCNTAPVSEGVLRRMRQGLYDNGPSEDAARKVGEWLEISEAELLALVADTGYDKPSCTKDRGTDGCIFKAETPMTAWGDLVEDKRERDGIPFEELEIAGVSPWTIRRYSKWPPRMLKQKYARGIAEFLGITEAEVNELHQTPGRNVPTISEEEGYEYPIATWMGVKRRPAIETRGSCEGCKVYEECRADVLAGGFAHCERLLEVDLVVPDRGARSGHHKGLH